MPQESSSGACADYLKVMPLEGDNLHSALHEQKWQPSTEQLVNLALCLADACAHVHSRGCCPFRCIEVELCYYGACHAVMCATCVSHARRAG